MLLRGQPDHCRAGSWAREQTGARVVGQELPPLVLPAVPRLVAIGDVHGDIEKTRRAFRLAGATDENDRWVGGQLVVVQVPPLPPPPLPLAALSHAPMVGACRPLCYCFLPKRWLCVCSLLEWCSV